MTHTSRAAAILVVALGAAACQASPEPESAPVEYTPPAWMTTRLQQVETAGATIEACMAAAGYVVEVEADGGIDRALTDTSDTAALAYDTALEGCDPAQHLYAETPTGAGSWDDLGYLYDLLLETAECLRSEGYDIPPATSRDAWIESGGADWMPYQFVWEESEDMTSTEWSRLKSTCVEPFTGYDVTF